MKLPSFIHSLTPHDAIVFAAHQKSITKRCTRTVTYNLAGKPGTARQTIEYQVSGMHLKGKSNDEETHCATLNALTNAEMGIPDGAVVRTDECRCGVTKKT